MVGHRFAHAALAPPYTKPTWLAFAALATPYENNTSELHLLFLIAVLTSNDGSFNLSNTTLPGLLM